MGHAETRLIRLTDGQRLLLQVVSVLLIVVGVALFLSFFFMMFSVDPPSSSDEALGHMGALAARGVTGIVLLSLGSFMAKFAFLRPASEIVATETAGAVQHASGAVGRGLSSAGIGSSAPREVIKLRCRACGALDSEEATYCSACGKPM